MQWLDALTECSVRQLSNNMTIVFLSAERTDKFVYKYNNMSHE